MSTNPLIGVILHSIGAFSSSSCYTPQKKTTLWAWEVYWISQATFAWLILPIVFAFLTIPNYLAVLSSVPTSVMLKSFGIGAFYGIGGLTFGLGVRYIGFSLNYSVAIGLSAALGTLMPLIWSPIDGFVWEIGEKFSTTPGLIILIGILIAIVGIVICGYAGALRERNNTGSKKFNLRLGLPLAIIAGVLSACFNYALLAGEPLETAALKEGASQLLKMNAIYPFSNGGAWMTNLIWCIVLIKRNSTGSQFLRLGEGGNGKLTFYYAMALLSGAFWYFQFFFYGMGHYHMGIEFGFTSWVLHMSMLILFSNLWGFIFKEWVSADKLPKRILHLGMACIVLATVLIAWGNYLGNGDIDAPAIEEIQGRESSP